MSKSNKKIIIKNLNSLWLSTANKHIIWISCPDAQVLLKNEKVSYLNWLIISKLN